MTFSPHWFSSSKKGTLLRLLLILLAGLFVYYPALHGGRLWDDEEEIGEDSAVSDPAGFVKIWRAEKGMDYLPVKSSLQWLYFRVAGTNQTAWHVLTLSLHLFCALLVWRLFDRLGVDPAWLGGLLFAVHPVMIDSVAWISELKNTLSLAFLLLSMLAFLEYDRRPRWPAYLSSLALFVLAAMSKGSVVMFPFVIMLYSWWKRGRISWRDLSVSVPFFVVSLILGLVTIHFQFQRAIAYEISPMGGFLSRLASAGIAIVFYFSKIILPINLSPIYPRWNVNPPEPAQFLPWFLIAGILFWLWMMRRTWGSGVLFGLGFFLINLFPVLGFINMSFMRASWVSDHFVYLPSIGVIGLMVAGTGWLCRRLEARRFLVWAVGGVVLAFYMLTARAYARVFASEEIMWVYTLSQNSDAWIAHSGLARLLKNEDLPLAHYHASEAMRLRPDVANVRNNYAITLERMGRTQEALAEYREAIRLGPGVPLWRINLGRLLLHHGQIDEGRAVFEKLIRDFPVDAKYHCEYGGALYVAGLSAEAVAQYRKALSIEPGLKDAEHDLEYILKRDSANEKRQP